MVNEFLDKKWKKFVNAEPMVNETKVWGFICRKFINRWQGIE